MLLKSRPRGRGRGGKSEINFRFESVTPTRAGTRSAVAACNRAANGHAHAGGDAEAKTTADTKCQRLKSGNPRRGETLVADHDDPLPKKPKVAVAHEARAADKVVARGLLNKSAPRGQRRTSTATMGRRHSKQLCRRLPQLKTSFPPRFSDILPPVGLQVYMRKLLTEKRLCGH